MEFASAMEIAAAIPLPLYIHAHIRDIARFYFYKSLSASALLLSISDINF